MSYYVTDFNKIRQDKSILGILEALERGFEKFGIDYYLIGAVAREVWMRGLKDITPRRATSDIDFAILIKDISQFNDLKQFLIKTEGFSHSKENAFVLIAPDKRQIDIMPFGAVEKEGRVTVKGTGMTTIYVDGMKEVYEESIEEVTFENKITFKVCTLPGIVLLKFIAWDDRPEKRIDDLVDIADIMSHFFNLYDEIIWSGHNDLFDDDSDLEIISARVLGREIGKILSRNRALKDRIMGILSDIDKTNRISTTIAVANEKSIDYVQSLIDQIVAGINDIKV